MDKDTVPTVIIAPAIYSKYDIVQCSGGLIVVV